MLDTRLYYITFYLDLCSVFSSYCLHNQKYPKRPLQGHLGFSFDLFMHLIGHWESRHWERNQFVYVMPMHWVYKKRKIEAMTVDMTFVFCPFLASKIISTLYFTYLMAMYFLFRQRIATYGTCCFNGSNREHWEPNQAQSQSLDVVDLVCISWPKCRIFNSTLLLFIIITSG